MNANLDNCRPEASEVPGEGWYARCLQHGLKVPYPKRTRVQALATLVLYCAFGEEPTL